MAIGKTNALTVNGETPIPETGDWLVRYFDVDGTLLKSQLVNNGQNATPPSNPNYDPTYLTFNTWNQVSTNVTSNRDIGAIYNTVDNKSYAFITLTTASGVAPTLYFNKSDGSTLSVNWGDGNTSTFTNSGNFNTGTHTYSTVGTYVISMWISSGTGTYSFSNASSSTTFIGGNTQSYKNTLKSLYISNLVTNIPSSAFYNCYTLITVSIPSSVTSIGTSAFYSCYSLNLVNIPSSVTSISASTFQTCYTLITVSIPSSVTSIGSSAFQDCVGLTSINIPSSVTSIGQNAFYNSRLRSITIPSSIKSISDSLFAYCQALVSVSLPNTITTIGTGSFSYCNSLKTISIPSSVTLIYSTAFYNCYSLTSISIPSSVTSIGQNAFYNCYCMKQYKIYRKPTPTALSTTVFNNINSTCKIYVPDAALSTYKTATNWSSYANYIYPLSDIGE